MILMSSVDIWILVQFLLITSANPGSRRWWVVLGWLGWLKLFVRHLSLVVPSSFMVWCSNNSFQIYSAYTFIYFVLNIMKLHLLARPGSSLILLSIWKPLTNWWVSLLFLVNCQKYKDINCYKRKFYDIQAQSLW